MLDKNIPVFANHRPWNELILRGARKFKTLSFPWKYRGPIYLYDTKSRVDVFAEDWASERNVRIKAEAGHPGKIVGTVEVYDVRSHGDCEEFTDGHEILIRKPKRFSKPIPFNWPAGAIRIAKIKA